MLAHARGEAMGALLSHPFARRADAVAAPWTSSAPGHRNRNASLSLAAGRLCQPLNAETCVTDAQHRAWRIGAYAALPVQTLARARQPTSG